MKNSFEIDLNASAETVWNAVRNNFGEAGQWTSLLDSSHMVGAVSVGAHRVCQQGKKQLTEHITAIDEGRMVLHYELIEGRPNFIARAQNAWTVTALGPDQSRVTMRPVMTLKPWAFFMGPLLAMGLRGPLTKVLEEFKYWVETGEIHPRKRAQMSGK